MLNSISKSFLLLSWIALTSCASKPTERKDRAIPTQKFGLRTVLVNFENDPRAEASSGSESTLFENTQDLRESFYSWGLSPKEKDRLKNSFSNHYCFTKTLFCGSAKVKAGAPLFNFRYTPAPSLLGRLSPQIGYSIEKMKESTLQKFSLETNQTQFKDFHLQTYLHYLQADANYKYGFNLGLYFY